MKPSDMTDEQLNTEIALLAIEGDFDESPDYCNNWNDLMDQIMLWSERVALFRDGTAQLVASNMTVFEFYSENNPQRALAQCLLLVLRNKEGV